MNEFNNGVAEGQWVLLKDFSKKKIEEISLGDALLSFDLQTLKFCITEVINIEEREKDITFLLDSEEDSIWVSLNTELFLSYGIQNMGWRTYESIKRKDAIYHAYVWDTFYQIENKELYSLGYIRGLTDGDGRTKGERGVFFCQKEKDVVEEYIDIYNEYIKPTKMNIRQQKTGNTEMNIVHGGEDSWRKLCSIMERPKILEK